MAKNKHEKMAQALKEVIHGIDTIFGQTETFLECVQFHFYEKAVIFGRPQPREKAFKCMMKAHALGLRFYSPHEEIRSACTRLPYIGMVVPKPIITQSELLITTSNEGGKWLIPWGVKVVLPHQNKPLIEKARLEAFLYCPDPSEVSNEIEWFEKEDLSGTFTNQVISVLDENRDDAIIKANLSQPAKPCFIETIKKWSQKDSSDNIPQNPKSVLQAPFAPDDECSVAIAYEQVRRSIRERKLHNYHHLKTIWRIELERLVFQNLSWSTERKNAFIHKWEQGIFSKTKQPPSKNGRWNQCQAIDRETASRIIRYFVDLFLNDPESRKQYGEIACLLWICIFASQEGTLSAAHLHEIYNLTTQQLDRDNLTLQIGQNEVNISSGLCNLLTCLLGKGQGIRNRRLFENSTSLDRLQDALKCASKAVLGDWATPVLPSAFLSFPHAFKQERISASKRQAIAKANGPQQNVIPDSRSLAKSLKNLAKSRPAAA